MLQSSWRRYKNIPRTGHKRFPVSNKKPWLINSPVFPSGAPGNPRGEGEEFLSPESLERRGISSITRPYIRADRPALRTYSGSRDEINSERHFSHTHLHFYRASIRDRRARRYFAQNSSASSAPDGSTRARIRLSRVPDKCGNACYER